MPIRRGRMWLLLNDLQHVPGRRRGESCPAVGKLVPNPDTPSIEKRSGAIAIAIRTAGLPGTVYRNASVTTPIVTFASLWEAV